MPLAYLGIGSNLGNRFENIRTAIIKLSSLGELKNSSFIWETSPWGYTSQPLFLNCVSSLETALSPLELLGEISQIEKKLCRKRTQKFGPRTIDIDILFYDTIIINTPELIIPHLHLHKRKFVLLPLSEIAPNFIHPVLKKEIKELLKDLNSEEECKLFFLDTL